MSDRNVTIRILVNNDRLRAALERCVGAMNDLARAADDWCRRTQLGLDELTHPRRTGARMAAGPRQADEYGRWQSWMCAAWLHDSCEHPRLAECGCTCHGGDLR